MDKKELNISIDSVKSSIGKRLIAFIVDFLVTFFVAILINSYIFRPIFVKHFQLEEKQLNYQNLLVESGLYFEEDGYFYTIDYINNYQTMNETQYLTYLDDKITAFYNNTEFVNESNKNQFIEAKKEAANVFVYDEKNNTFVFADGVEFNEKLQFYKDALKDALAILEKNDSIFSFMQEYYSITIMSFIISLFFPLLIFFMIIPLCFKNGATLGKYLFNLGIIDLDSKQYAKKLQLVIRFFTFFVLELLFSIITFGLIILVSFAISIFNKNHRCIHDFLCKTIVIDTKKYVFEIQNSLETGDFNGRKK